MVPDDGSMDRPAGSPVADQVSVAPDAGRRPSGQRRDRPCPRPSDWSPGEVTVRVLVIDHVKVADPE